jgi:ABC-type transport system substrate-binding protein
VKLKDNIFWEDGERITTDDVLFTISLIQNPETKSPLRNSWLGVEVEKSSNSLLIFRLKRPSAVFLENLTLRPIPKHFFKDILPQNLAFSIKNFAPLSSGPFKLGKINRDQAGKIISLELKRNEKYFGKKPYLEKIIFKIFDKEENLILAAKEKLISGFLAKEKKEIEGFEVLEFSLPRYFALFFNLENQALKEKKIREALSLAIDKKEILKEVLENQGKIVNSPLLPNFYNLEKEEVENYDLDGAISILEKEGFLISNGVREKVIKKEPSFQFKNDLKLGSRGEEVKELQKCLAKFEDVYPEGEITGYFGNLTKKAVILFQEKFKEEILEPSGLEKGTGIVGKSTRKKLNQICFERGEERIKLDFSLVTGKDEILRKCAEKIKENLEKLGVKIDLKFVEPEKLERETIPKKDYDLLLFGEMYGKILDPFPFWHSSQIDGGLLNLSNFKNEDIDKILLEARETIDRNLRIEKLKEFEEIILKEKPAVFLFTPDLHYFVAKEIKGVNGGKIFEISERFSEIEKWYQKEKRILK